MYIRTVQLSRGLIELTQQRPFDVSLTDVPAFVDLAISQRVIGLLVPELLVLPGVDESRVAALDLLGRHRYSVAEKELQRIAEVAESVGVSFAVLKGAAHAERWFVSDPAVRQFSDLDLFIDPSNPDGLKRLLSALDPEHFLASHSATLMATGVLPDIPITSGTMLIELHSNPLSLNLSERSLLELWASTEPWVTRSGGNLRRLDATTALLHALINSAKDNHSFLLQVVEIGRGLQDPTIDWARLEETVRRRRWDAVIDDSIRFVCSTLQIDRPPVTFAPTRLDRSILRRLTPDKDRLGGRAAWHRAQRFAKLDFAVPGTRRKSARGVLSRTFSPDEMIRAYAPDMRGPYILRAARFWFRRQQYVKGHRTSLSGPDESLQRF